MDAEAGLQLRCPVDPAGNGWEGTSFLPSEHQWPRCFLSVRPWFMVQALRAPQTNTAPQAYRSLKMHRVDRPGPGFVFPLRENPPPPQGTDRQRDMSAQNAPDLRVKMLLKVCSSQEHLLHRPEAILMLSKSQRIRCPRFTIIIVRSGCFSGSPCSVGISAGRDQAGGAASCSLAGGSLNFTQVLVREVLSHGRSHLTLL